MSKDEKKPAPATQSAGPQTLLMVGVIVILAALAFVVWLIASGAGQRAGGANAVAATDASNMAAPAPAAPADPPLPNRGRLLPSGLRIETVREGTGRAVRPTDTALVRYELRAVGSNEVIDGGMDRPAVPMSPSGGLIPGFAEGLTQIREGGEAIFWVPPRLGYGDQGPDPRIGPTTVLEFRVRVERILPAGAQGAGDEAAPAGNSPNMTEGATESPAGR
jgi:hypothetical protein